MRVEKEQLKVTRLVRRQVDTNLFIGAYAIHDKRVFCMAHQNDVNRQQLAILDVRREQEEAEFEYVDFAGTVAKTHLSSELLKDDGFTCWQPIQMDSAQMPVFVVAFGCKMRFRSFYRNQSCDFKETLKNLKTKKKENSCRNLKIEAFQLYLLRSVL